MLEEVRCIRLAMVKLERAKRVGKKYLNPVETEMGGLSKVVKLLPRYWSNKAEVVPKTAVGPFRTDVRVYETAAMGGLRVTWFGHSGMLLEVDGVRVLIDPVWEERASPLKFAGPKRFFAPTLRLEQMPQVDVVVISHDHYDHLGAETVGKLARLMPEARWVTSAGVGKILVRFGVQAGRVTELDWTDTVEVVGVKITAVPGRHFSGRAVWNRFETLWSGFVFQGATKKVYYTGDTGYWNGFPVIAAAYGPFDLTIMEIGASDREWREVHIGPELGAQAFGEMGAQGLLMPVHWGLFNLALHGWREPMEVLTRVAAELGYRLFSPEPGRPEEVRELVAGWWRE